MKGFRDEGCMLTWFGGNRQRARRRFGGLMGKGAVRGRRFKMVC